MPTRQELAMQTGQRLAYLLKHADRLLAELHVEALAPFNLHVRELGVLLVIDRSEPASQQQIAERMGVDRTTMVSIIDALEAKGIIARRPDAEDRRRNLIELTPTGQEILRQATAASDAAEAKLLAPLTLEEDKQLRNLIARVLNRD
ncbi:MAG: MarR family winged helix-turn-helix transcriptional regulator [Solirubrobacteraceae bacterium]